MTDACGQSEANVVNVANFTGLLVRMLPPEVLKKVMPIGSRCNSGLLSFLSFNFRGCREDFRI